MDYVPAHHYELQTFTEKRETSWTYAPHKVCFYHIMAIKSTLTRAARWMVLDGGELPYRGTWMSPLQICSKRR